MSFSLFPAFFENPQKFHFIEQEVDEQIHLLLRQHWITNVPWIFTTIILIFLPIVFLSINGNLDLISLQNVPSDIVTSVVIFWYLGVLAYLIEQFLHWYFNIYIITNKHLVDINFYNLINRDITETRLAEIQSSSSNIVGIIESLFNYGDVIIETAAEGQKITFLSVPKPDKVADHIQDLRAKFKE